MKTSLLVLLLTVTNLFADPSFRTIGEVKALAPERAALKLPVEFDLLVLKIGVKRHGLFAHDGLEGIYVAARDPRLLSSEIRQGDVVRVKGTTNPGLFIPHIDAREIRRVSRRALPDPVRITGDSLLNPNLDCAWVEVEGIVIGSIPGGENLSLRLKCYGNHVVNLVVPRDKQTESEAAKLVNRAVTARGVAITTANDQRQMMARYFRLDSLADIIPKSIDPDVPLARVGHLLRTETGMLESVKVRGSLTHVDGSRIYLQDESGGLLVQVRDEGDWKEGDGVEVSGLVMIEAFTPVLRAQEIKRFEVLDEPVPLRIDPELRPLPSLWNNRLVTLDADLLDVRTEGNGVVLSCSEKGMIFDVSLDAGRGPLDRIEPGSRLRLRGICTLRTSHPFSLDYSADGIALILRRGGDVELLSGPPFWNLNKILFVLAIMVVAAVVSLAWVGLLRRRVADQTGIIGAQIEREVTLRERQSLARELHDTIEQNMSTLALQVSTAERHRSAGNADRLQASLGLAQRMIAHFKGECREAIYDLRQGELGATSLGQDVLLLTEAELFNGTVETRSTGDSFPLNSKVECQVERIVREAALNALRHGEAKNVRISYRYCESTLEVEVADDGCGFDVEQPIPRGHFGITGMRERAQRIGAVLVLSSEPGEGSKVSLSVPREEESK